MSFKDKLINHNQIGGIESYVVDNGMGRGSRVTWFNTGSGLRFKVAIDRGLDIVDAFYGKDSLAWLSHNGLACPRRDSNRGREWLGNFAGGLVTTCGLTHFGGPEQGENEERGVHGKYNNLPAELESVVQPDLNDSEPVMSISGKVRQSTVFGPNLEVKRSISCKLGSSVITLKDKVTNVGNTASPHMLLYHCNFGWPLVDEGTRIFYDGEVTNPGKSKDDIFHEANDYKCCRSPMDEHSGTGEACGFIKPNADAEGLCRAGLYNESLGFAVMITFKKEQLPCLTNWQHWGRGEYVTGIEPGTNFPFGQNAAREQKALIMLEPGESREYEIEFEVLTDKNRIQEVI